MKNTSVFCKVSATVFTLVFFVASSLSQTSIPIGQIQNGAAVLTTTESQFNSDMSSVFPGRTYSNLQLLSAIDSSGLFFYLRVTVNESYPAAIILDQTGTNISFLSSTGCEMKCTWTGNCTGCNQNIIVKCKSQKCEYNATSGGGGFGGCSSSITFPNQ